MQRPQSDKCRLSLDYPAEVNPRGDTKKEFVLTDSPVHTTAKITNVVKCAKERARGWVERGRRL